MWKLSENMKWNITKQVAEQMEIYEKQDVNSQNWKVIKVTNNNLCDWEEKAKPAFESIITHRKFPMAVYTRGFKTPVLVADIPDLLVDLP